MNAEQLDRIVSLLPEDGSRRPLGEIIYRAREDLGVPRSAVQPAIMDLCTNRRLALETVAVPPARGGGRRLPAARAPALPRAAARAAAAGAGPSGAGGAAAAGVAGREARSMRRGCELHALVRDLRAVGIPYEPDVTFPPPVRHLTALYIAIGHLCERIDAVHASFPFPSSQLRTLGSLRRRTSSALDWVKALGKRSRWAGWTCFA